MVRCVCDTRGEASPTVSEIMIPNTHREASHTVSGVCDTRGSASPRSRFARYPLAIRIERRLNMEYALTTAKRNACQHIGIRMQFRLDSDEMVPKP